MNKLLASIIFLGFFAGSAIAQTKAAPQPPAPLPTGPQLSFGGEFGLPVTSSSNQPYGSVFGASAKLELPFSTMPAFFTLTAGITEYALKLDDPNTANASAATFVPLEAGAKFYFSRIGYVEGDAGVSLNVSDDYPGEKNAFIFAPIIGFTALTPKHKATVDIGLRYETRLEPGGYSGQVALRLAYRFGL
jgi:hypothetical protein